MDTESGDHNKRLIVRDLGEQPYVPIWQAMQNFTNSRTPHTNDELWLLSHPPVFTQGQAGKAEHLLCTGDIPVVEIDRGGQVTYHGPGQIVGYPLLDLRRQHLGPRALVSALEQAIITTLSTIGINASADPGAPGVYVDGVKIASIGLRIRRGCSYHGLALNIDMNLEPFSRINPCGYSGLTVTDVARLVPQPDSRALKSLLIKHLCNELGYTGFERTNQLLTSDPEDKR